MDNKEEKTKSRLAHQADWENLPWKAWGSWFSWGSPIGLGFFLSVMLISLGFFLYLLHLAGIIH